VIFFIFQSSKICFSPTSVISSSLSPPRCPLSSIGRCDTATLFHASFPLTQDELDASASSSCNALSRRLTSRVEIEALNLHHHCRLPSPDRSTPTLHCYKNIISTLTTLHITQSRLYFTSSLAKAPCHRSSTYRRRFLSPLSHVYHLYTQQ
jgi:hypothetical protein